MNTNRGFSIVFKVALIVVIVLAYSVFISAARSQMSGTRSSAQGDQFLPIIMHQIPPTFTPTPTATATPALANVYIENDTGGRLCYEVVNSGIGRKCSSEANFFYGSFQPGTYTWKASARCGSASGTSSYPSGDTEHRFFCVSNLQTLP